MEISIVAPSPVACRRYSAARIEEKAYMPLAMSAAENPTLLGSAAEPVNEIAPASAWMARS